MAAMGLILSRIRLQYPAYVTVNNSGAATYAWQSSTTDVRALQKASSSTDRIAACLYTLSSQTYTIDMNITDGQGAQPRDLRAGLG